MSVRKGVILTSVVLRHYTRNSMMENKLFVNSAHKTYVAQVRFSSQNVTAQSSGNQGSNDNPKRKKLSNDWKMITSIAVGAISWLISSYFDRQRAKKDVQLNLVTKQIKDLYGPLYGNRLVQETTYRAVMGEYNKLRVYLKEAETKKDAAMIRRWRSFVINVLFPLDEQAENLITHNAHLLSACDFPPEFTMFLTHFARLKFVMERWKDSNGKLEKVSDFTEDDYLESNNASGERGLAKMLRHVEKEYQLLRHKQRALTVDVNSDDTDKFVSRMVAKLTGQK